VVTGVKSNLQKSIIQKKPQCGIIGVKVILQQSIIQKNCKMRDYRGKKHFTGINHSKKAQNAGL
jgi:hypothetical protein